MNSGYALNSPLFLTNPAFGHSFLRDAPSEERKRSVDFHVASGDYFGTLATVVGLVADALMAEGPSARNRGVKMLRDIRDELVYLQERCEIAPRR